MTLASKLKNYSLQLLLMRIARNEVSNEEIQALEELGIDAHARHFIVLTNGSMSHFMEMFGTVMNDTRDIDKISENLQMISQ